MIILILINDEYDKGDDNRFLILGEVTSSSTNPLTNSLSSPSPPKETN